MQDFILTIIRWFFTILSVVITVPITVLFKVTMWVLLVCVLIVVNIIRPISKYWQSDFLASMWEYACDYSNINYFVKRVWDVYC